MEGIKLSKIIFEGGTELVLFWDKIGTVLELTKDSQYVRITTLKTVLQPKTAATDPDFF